MGEIIMTTLNEMIEIIKAENPTIKIGDDDAGYTDLTATEYEAQIADWAKNRLAKLAKLAEAEAVATAKLDAVDKLTALGIDPKALGL
jgi:chloramphenicol O-acetyltransferase